MSEATVLSTRERIARGLAQLAAEPQDNPVGKAIQGVYAMGMGGQITAMIPADDAAADAQLEYLAGVLLALRSPESINRNPFEPVFVTEAPAAELDPVAQELGVPEGAVRDGIERVGLRAISIDDLSRLLLAMKTHDVGEWAGVTLGDVAQAIADLEESPDVDLAAEQARPYQEDGHLAADLPLAGDADEPEIEPAS